MTYANLQSKPDPCDSFRVATIILALYPNTALHKWLAYVHVAVVLPYLAYASRTIDAHDNATNIKAFIYRRMYGPDLQAIPIVCGR